MEQPFKKPTEINYRPYLKLRKKRSKQIGYAKISNEAREKLIDFVTIFYKKNQVFIQDYLVKDAAKILNLNPSSAKGIIRTFRKERRVEKLNAEETRELKKFLEEKLKNNDKKKTGKENKVVIDIPNFNCKIFL